MPPSPPTSSRNAFTLLEVLAALALCVLLATVTATATIQSTRASRRAIRQQDQALRLRTLHATTRLHPASLSDSSAPSASSSWRVAIDEQLTPVPTPRRPASRLSDRIPSPPPPRRWTLLTLHDTTATLRPVQLAILETTP